jgi:hypothetical protein
MSIIIPLPWPTFSTLRKLIFQATHWKCYKFYSRPLTNNFYVVPDTPGSLFTVSCQDRIINVMGIHARKKIPQSLSG